MRFSKLHVCALIPLVAACATASNAPAPAPEITAKAASAIVPEQSFNTETFTFTISSIDVAQQVGGGNDFAGIGAIVDGENQQSQQGCGLGPAAAGRSLTTCTDPGTTGSLLGKNLSQTKTFTSQSESVHLGLVLENIVNTPPGVPESALGSDLNILGNYLQSAGSLAGIANGAVGGIIGAVGALVSLLGGAVGNGGATQSYIPCNGGLIATANPPYQEVINPSTPSYTATTWWAVPNAPKDTMYLTYSLPQLEALTATGPVTLKFPVGVQYPSTVTEQGFWGPYQQPVALMGDAPGYCDASLTIELTIARTLTDGPAADPIASSTGTARTGAEFDGLVADPGHDALVNVQWTPNSGWVTGVATQSVFETGAYAPTATLSRAIPPPGALLMLVPPPNSNTPGTTNLQWDVDSFWFDATGTLRWTSWANGYGWSTTAIATPLSGVANGRLTATSRTPSNLDVFWINAYGNLMQSSMSGGSFGGLPSVVAAGAGPAGGGVAAVARAYNAIDVFYVNGSGTLMDSSFVAGAGWSTQARSGAGIAPAGAYVTAVARDANTIDAFVLGANGQVYDAHYAAAPVNGYQAGWTGAMPIPGTAGSAGAPIAAASRTQATLDVVYLNGNQLELLQYGSPINAAGWAPPQAVVGANNVTPYADLSLAARDQANLALYYRDWVNNARTALWSSSSTSWQLSEPALPAWKWQGWDSASGGLVTDPAIAAPTATEIVTAAVGPDSVIYINTHDSAVSPSWLNWQSLGGYQGHAITDAPAMVAAGGKLQVFVRDSVTQHLLHQEGICESSTSCDHPAWNGTGWEELAWGGGPALIPGTPTVVVSQPNNQINVFATGTDGQAHFLKGTGYGQMGAVYVWEGPPGGYGFWEYWGDGQWTSLSGGVLSEPGAASWGSNRLDVFVRGTDNTLWHRYSNDNGTTWSPSNGNWEGVGGAVAATPSVTSWGANRLDVVVAGPVGQVQHLAWTGNAWSWDAIDGIAVATGASHPVAIAHGTGVLDVFAQGKWDQALYTATMTSAGAPATWTQWTEMASCFRTAGTPAVVSRDGANLDLTMTSWASNGDAAVWHTSTSGAFIGQNQAEPPTCR